MRSAYGSSSHFKRVREISGTGRSIAKLENSPHEMRPNARDTSRAQADRDSCDLFAFGVYRLSLSTLKIRFQRAR
jgi:hypothetical protein